MSKTVIISKIRSKSLHGTIDVSIMDNGDLDYGMYDFGSFVEDMWGKDDYEYDIIVRKEHIDDLLLQLIKEKFKTTSDFMEWLREKKIPYDASSW